MIFPYGPHLYLTALASGIDPECNKEKYFFYLDETGNYKELNYNSDKDKLNLPIETLLNDFFVLGGIVYEINHFDIKKLFLEFKEKWGKFGELKYSNLAGSGRRRKSFSKILEQSIISDLLELLLKNNIYLTYSVTNPLYWIVIDIIDKFSDGRLITLYKTYFYLSSLFLEEIKNIKFLAQTEEEVSNRYNFLQLKLYSYILTAFYSLKEELFLIIKKHLDTFSKLISKYLPLDLEDKKRAKAFLRDLEKLCFSSSEKTIYLKDFFRLADKSLYNPFFIKDPQNFVEKFFDIFIYVYRQNPFLGKKIFRKSNKIVLDDFSSIYLNYCITFPNSNIIYDREGSIEKKFKEDFQVKDLCSYTFLDSRNEILIQIADIISGLIRNLHICVLKNQCKEVMKSKTAEQNLKILSALIAKSEERCPAFILSILPISLHNKISDFLKNLYIKYNEDIL
jgi:hypothetical protein